MNTNEFLSEIKSLLANRAAELEGDNITATVESCPGETYHALKLWIDKTYSWRLTFQINGPEVRYGIALVSENIQTTGVNLVKFDQSVEGVAQVTDGFISGYKDRALKPVAI